jgi:glycosyltransferase involved in cell wall biosynthesis
MRIAYHNPWIDSSENQGFMSMAQAARRIGIDLVACGDETQIEACRPDFVLSVATSMAKITDYPTYLTMHEPKAYLLEQAQRMRNLFSYDGYLTIADSLARFTRDFCAGVGRAEQPGFFYLTPQISELRCDWTRADLHETLRVTYFGTNWNRRMPLLFRALDGMGILRIHGPEAAWRAEGYHSYQGPAAFDGVGPQRVYAQCGIGLALMDERWQREDVISNRVFEISSVGAVSICPDMPWTRKWFGDSVLYFDAERPLREIAGQVRLHHAFCLADPAAARQMGEAARAVFETHFAAEKMLAHAVDYHAAKTAQRAALLAGMPPAPRISVVLRCGGRGPEMLARAVDSIRRQTYGRFTVILAKYRDIDTSGITADRPGAIDGFVEFLIEQGDRARMLFAGLERVATEYFAVLDDDDFWLSDHFETLFRAGQRVRADFDMAFSGSVGFDYPVPYNETQTCNRNILRFGFSGPVVDGVDIQNAIGTNCFVARTDLLRPEMLPERLTEMPPAPLMRTAEDSLLICLLSWRSKPIFSYRPTAFYRRDAADGSNWTRDPGRADDELTFAFRAGLCWSPDWLASGSFAVPQRIWDSVRTTLGETRMGEKLDLLSVGAAGRRTRDGIAAIPATPGHVCFGPYLRLAPGRYLVVFLIDVPGPAAPGAIGGVEVVGAPLGLILARQDIEPDAPEITLRFTVDEAMADWRIEFRVFAQGGTALTVGSVALHRDTGPPPALPRPAPPPPPPPPEPPSRPQWPQPPGTGPEDAELAALRARLAALHASTSWRVTAPLRWARRRIAGPPA